MRYGTPQAARFVSLSALLPTGLLLAGLVLAACVEVGPMPQSTWVPDGADAAQGDIGAGDTGEGDVGVDTAVPVDAGRDIVTVGCSGDDECEEPWDGKDLCFTEYECVAGECAPVEASAKTCPSSGVACAPNRCVPESGDCVERPLGDDEPCELEDPCVLAASCQGGVCTESERRVCDDGADCTDDSCDSATGQCRYEDNGGCDDGIPCTRDTCVPFEGCQRVPDDGLCEDGSDACQQPGVCDPTTGCGFGPPVECPESYDSCRAAVCDPGDGVCRLEDANEGGACPLDDHPCGPEGRCEAGVCQAQGEGCGDTDHDGVVDRNDTCPDVWDPEQDGEACQRFDASLPLRKPVYLTVPGVPKEMSASARTAEPVEIPLVAGILDRSVVGYWPLDGDALDAGPRGVDGLAVDVTPTRGFLWRWASAVDFTGEQLSSTAAPSLSVASLKELELGTAVSVSAWIRILAVGDLPGTIVAKESFGGDSTFALRAGGVGGEFDGLSFIVWGDGASAEVGISREELPLHEWVHVAAVFDAGEMTLWLGGQPVARRAGDAVAVGYLQPSPYAALTIGGQPGAPTGRAFDGHIDDVVLFERPLAGAEIAAIAAAGMPFGAGLLEGSRADYGDVRIIEGGGVDGELHFVPSEIIGARPFPASRLGDVVAYLPLDGNARGVSNTRLVPESVDGRFVLGRWGRARAAFEGDSSGGLRYSDSGALTLTHFTVESWLLWDGARGSAGATDAVVVARKAGAAGYNYAVRVSPEGRLSCGFGGDDDAGLWVTAADGLRKRAWYHVACSWDGDRLELWLDGVRVAERAAGDAADKPPQGSGPLVVAGGSGTGFRGAVDDVVIHGGPVHPYDIRARAVPPLPTLRFLASTEGAADDATGRFPARGYEIVWGDPTQVYRDAVTWSPGAGYACPGLFNECRGMLGYWRFDAEPAGLALDSSAGVFDADYPGDDFGARYVGAQGLGLLLPNRQSGVELAPAGEALAGDALTVELVAAGGPDGATRSLLCNDTEPMAMAAGMFCLRYVEDVGGDGAWAELALQSGEPGNGYVVRAEGTPDPAEETLTLAATVTGAGDLGLRVNGALFERADPVGNDVWPAPPAVALPVWLGAVRDPGGDLRGGIVGVVDELRVHTRALADDELLHYPRLSPWVADWTYPEPDGQPTDEDGDGLSDALERQFGLRADREDSDQDGIPDPDEWGDDPGRPRDYDGDGDYDAVDGAFGEDTDQDGIPDVDEVAVEDDDGVPAYIDNCPAHANPLQIDDDGDGVGDGCPVTWWRFDGHGMMDQEGGAAFVPDHSGFQHHATLYGDGARRPGKVGLALTFDGAAVGDGVAVELAHPSDGGSPFSVEMWLRPHRAPEGAALLAAGAGTWALVWDGDDIYWAISRPEGGGPWTLLAEGVLQSEDPPRWHHVAAAWDPVGDWLRIYVDGDVVAEQAPAGLDEISVAQQNTVLAFGDMEETVGSFPGQIDEVKFWNRALVPDRLGRAPRSICGLVGDGPDGGREMCWVEAGSFLRGSTTEDDMAEEDEQPQSEVWTDELWLDRDEVDVGSYHACYEEGVCGRPDTASSTCALLPWPPSEDEAGQPMRCLTWYDAATYCWWAGKRLPSEAEWEHAARGRLAPLWPWGDVFDVGLANCAESACGDGFPGAANVATFPDVESPFGLRDMGGNVAELVWDYYDHYGAANERLAEQLDPQGPCLGLGVCEGATGTDRRVVRGGHAQSAAAALRTADRAGFREDDAAATVGFRCAWSPCPEDCDGVSCTTEDCVAGRCRPVMPTGRWAATAARVERFDVAAAAVDDWVYVAGGASSVLTSRLRVSREFRRLSLLDGVTSVELTDLPAARIGARAVVVGRTLYVTGGAGGLGDGLGDVSGNIWGWDIDQELTWDESLPSMDHPRRNHAVAEVDGTVYVIGGEDGSDNPMSDVERWTPGDSAWGRIEPLPAARTGAVAVEWMGQIYLFGGAVAADGAAPTPTDEVLRISPWETGEAVHEVWTHMPTPLVDMGVARLGDYVVVTGGSKDNAGQGVTTTHLLHLPSGVWYTLDEAPLPVATVGGVLVGGADRLMLLGGRAERSVIDALTDGVYRLHWCE